jgi:hypothetical protein
MANADRPFGLRPVRYKSGAPWNGQATPYYVDSGNGTALFLGDPVVSNGNANAARIGRGHEPGTLVSVIRATAGDAAPILGVVVGVEPETRDSTVHRVASTSRVVYVADDPDLIFHVQDDGGGTPGEGNAFLNANLIYTHAGSAVTGQSGAEINGATWAADQSFQILVLGIARLPNNEVSSDNAIWEVMINTHQLKGGAVGTTLGIA